MTSTENPGLWADLASAVIDLLPVVVGGAIAYLAGRFQATHAQRLNERHVKTEHKRRQLERLVEAAYELDPWSTRQENYQLFGGEEPIETWPVANIETVCLLYLPELREKSDDLAKAASNYYGYLLEGRQKRLNNGLTASDQYIDGIGDYWSSVLTARTRLLDAASKVMGQLSE